MMRSVGHEDVEAVTVRIVVFVGCIDGFIDVAVTSHHKVEGVAMILLLLLRYMQGQRKLLLVRSSIYVLECSFRKRHVNDVSGCGIPIPEHQFLTRFRHIQRAVHEHQGLLHSAIESHFDDTASWNVANFVGRAGV